MDDSVNDSHFGHEARMLNAEECQRLLADTKCVPKFKQEKLEEEAKKNWDLFYKRNETRFFKDRHWTKREFDDLTNHCISPASSEKRPILLEVGCGVGNFMFPLIEEKTKFFIYACDFSPRAIEFVKNNSLYSAENCFAFQCDITDDKLREKIEFQAVDVASMIFVLSSIHPTKMSIALRNVFDVMTPGGIFLFRDYGLYDKAMLRFKPGKKLAEKFYVRQDGTRAFYFDKEMVEQLAIDVGFEILECTYVNRQTVNKKEGIDAIRVFVQGRFRKPSSIR